MHRTARLCGWSRSRLQQRSVDWEGGRKVNAPDAVAVRSTEHSLYWYHTSVSVVRNTYNYSAGTAADIPHSYGSTACTRTRG